MSWQKTAVKNLKPGIDYRYPGQKSWNHIFDVLPANDDFICIRATNGLRHLESEKRVETREFRI